MLNVPDTPKVKTKIYENFKGVDYTNDSTNVWHRRSPSGVNMLPDASGRPFKRKGWETIISADDLLPYLSLEETTIFRCFYFELAGIDHIIIFADGGVFKYSNNTLTYLTGSNDADCYASYDRAFFFEGGGRSAFYIYGSYKVWIYRYENGSFNFSKANYGDGEWDIKIPTVLYSASADCAGEKLEDYNMLSNLIRVEYNSNDLFYYRTSGDLVITVTKETFTTAVSSARGVYEFEYDGTNWTYNDATIDLATYGISILIGTAEEDDTITVIYKYGVMLPQNISQVQVDYCSAFVTKVKQFDYELDVVSSSGHSPSSSQCVLHTDESSYPSTERQAWIEFDADYSTTTQEDTIRVCIPSTEVNIENIVDEIGGGTAAIDGKRG